jgi:hypothetical protein
VHGSIEPWGSLYYSNLPEFEASKAFYPLRDKHLDKYAFNPSLILGYTYSTHTTWKGINWRDIFGFILFEAIPLGRYLINFFFFFLHFLHL